MIFTGEVVVIFLTAGFLSLISLIFAWAGCQDYCQHEASFWSVTRAGRLALGVLASGLAALALKFASENRFRAAAISGLIAIAGVSVVAASL